MRREALAAVALIGLGWLVPGRAQDKGRTVLARGLFSYEAPPGWRVSDINLSQPVSQGSMRDGFMPNIDVDIVTSSLPLAQFVAESLRAARGTPGFRLVSEAPFSTAAGLDGQRVVVTETIEQRGLQQIFYFFDGGNDQKIMVSASCLAQDGVADAAMFDVSVKTFSLE
jgi:hypothetical protein